MAHGISLHIGLNSVDPTHYSGWSGDLYACEADAESMKNIADSLGYGSSILLTTKATREGVLRAIREAAKALVPGDIFLVSYAGHGGQVPDANGDEPDGLDETWCLYDGMLIDDELHQLWKEFPSRVRVLVLSDSCHSGTVTRAAQGTLDLETAARELKSFGIQEPRFRFMPPATAIKTYRANQTFYQGLGRTTPREEGLPAATVRLLSACMDDQTSADGVFHGLFTEILLKVWNQGAFDGNYAQFHREIGSQMPKCQQPNHYVLGPGALEFDQQRPFSI